MGIGLKVCFSVSLIWRKLPLLYWVFSPFLDMLQLALHLFGFSKCLSIVAFGAVSIRTNGICLVSQSQKGASERYVLERRLWFWAGQQGFLQSYWAGVPCKSIHLLITQTVGGLWKKGVLCFFREPNLKQDTACHDACGEAMEQLWGTGSLFLPYGS